VAFDLVQKRFGLYLHLPTPGTSDRLPYGTRQDVPDLGFGTSTVFTCARLKRTVYFIGDLTDNDLGHEASPLIDIII
jgi:hypothetical protein